MTGLVGVSSHVGLSVRRICFAIYESKKIANSYDMSCIETSEYERVEQGLHLGKRVLMDRISVGMFTDFSEYKNGTLQ